MCGKTYSIWYAQQNYISHQSAIIYLIKKNKPFPQVLIIDPVMPESRSIVKLAESFVIHLAPIRLGIVFDSSQSSDGTDATYRAINCAFNYVSQSKTPRDALGYLTDVSMQCFVWLATLNVYVSRNNVAARS